MDYISVSDLSSELNVSVQSIYAKAKKMDIDTKKIGDQEKEMLRQSFTEVSKLKKNASEFEKASASVQCTEISSQSGSTLEQRLADAKQKFDNLNRTIANYQLAIDTYGDVFTNESNGQPYVNPVQKSLNDALKQYAVINKTINELEEKLKYSVSVPADSVIDD